VQTFVIHPLANALLICEGSAQTTIFKIFCCVGASIGCTQ